VRAVCNNGQIVVPIVVVAIVIGAFAVVQLALVVAVLVRGRRLRKRGALPEFASRLAHALLLVAVLAILGGAFDLFDSLGEMDVFGVSATRKEEIFDTGLAQAAVWSVATASISGVAWLATWFWGARGTRRAARS
jgi:hypothetical protein